MDRFDRTVFCRRIFCLQGHIQVRHVDVLLFAFTQIITAAEIQIHAGNRTNVIVNNAAGRFIEHASHCLHDGNGTRHTSTVVVTLHAVTGADNDSLGTTVHIGKFFDLLLGQAGNAFDILPVHRINFGNCLIGTDTAILQEVMIDHVMGNQILHDAGSDPCVSRGFRLQIDIGL